MVDDTYSVVLKAGVAGVVSSVYSFPERHIYALWQDSMAANVLGGNTTRAR